MKKSLTKIVLAIVAIISLISTPAIALASSSALFQVAIAGRVSAVNSNMVSVQAVNGSSYAVDITGITITIHGGRQFVFGNLTANDQVTVSGQLNSNNRIVAKSLDITVKVPTPITINGQIVGISNDSLTILANDGTNFNVLKTNALVTVNGQVSNFSVLVGSDQVTVNGVLAGVNKISAQSINVNVSATPAQAIYGRVVSVSTSSKTFVLQFNDGVTYTVYAGNASISINGILSSLSDLKAGDKIDLTGQWIGANTFLAKTITKVMETGRNHDSRFDDKRTNGRHSHSR